MLLQSEKYRFFKWSTLLRTYSFFVSYVTFSLLTHCIAWMHARILFYPKADRLFIHGNTIRCLKWSSIIKPYSKAYFSLFRCGDIHCDFLTGTEALERGLCEFSVILVDKRGNLSIILLWIRDFTNVEKPAMKKRPFSINTKHPVTACFVSYKHWSSQANLSPDKRITN